MKKKKPKGLFFIKLGIAIIGRKMWRHLIKESKNCERAQRKVLTDFIEYAEETAYGKEHNFADISTPQDYQQSVPINSYETLKPYILRHTQGEANVLFPGKPFIYATTSGTTKDPKWIPITHKYNDECYNGLTKLWFYTMLREKPDLLEGPDLTVVGRSEEGTAPDGTPYGSFSGHMNKHIPEFLKRLKVVPYQVYDIPDYFSKYYTLLRLCIEHDIYWMTTGNPSTLLEIKRLIEENIGLMIEDIEKGTLREDIEVPDAIRTVVTSPLKPNPERADELRRIAAAHRDDLLPKHYWPNLTMINTWTQGNSGLYLKHAEGYFSEDAKIREFGYLATEARAGIILNCEQTASILAAHLLFFEFIRRDEYGSANPKVYLAHELEEGEYYYLLVTTPSGLYRYDMNDIVRIDGFYNEFPMFTFIQKGSGVTSLTGEKLSEDQYLAAVKEIEKEMGFRTKFHIGFGDLDTSSYHVYVEFPAGIGAEATETFITTLDTKLMEMNIEYKSKRESNRIREPQLRVLKENAFDDFKRECMRRGYRGGQFKLMHLMIDDERKKMFEALVAVD